MNVSKLKIIVLTDSLGNPRSFPANMAVDLEETYPYLIRKRFPNAIFWQLSYGNLRTEELFNQAIGYLNNWDPDFIVVQSGINDCRPEAFTDFQKLILKSFTGPIFRYLNKTVNDPRLIKFRQIKRVSVKSYRKSLKKFKLIFNNSKILITEICSAKGYERARPGVSKRICDYNDIIREIYEEDVVLIQDKLNFKRGFNEDNLHLNALGHQIVADEIIKKIKHNLKLRKKIYDKT